MLMEKYLDSQIVFLEGLGSEIEGPNTGFHILPSRRIGHSSSFIFDIFLRRRLAVPIGCHLTVIGLNAQALPADFSDCLVDLICAMDDSDQATSGHAYFVLPGTMKQYFFTVLMNTSQ